jgi:probable metal-binding protein
MTVKVHAHQVLDILDQYSTPISLSDLRAKVTDAFGSDIQFTNCQDDCFTFEQLIDFMTLRQKIVRVDGTIRLNKAGMCNH